LVCAESLKRNSLGLGGGVGFEKIRTHAPGTGSPSSVKTSMVAMVSFCFSQEEITATEQIQSTATNSLITVQFMVYVFSYFRAAFFRKSKPEEGLSNATNKSNF